MRYLRRPWPWLLLAVLLLRPVTAHRRVRAERQRPPASAAPNVVILIGDDHAAGTLGVDGDARRATPRLDGLARQGMRFDRAFCNSPVCTASRQSFITGRLPHTVGVTRLSTPLPESAVTLGHRFGELGYATAAIGKMHFNGPSHHGFELRVDTPDWQRWVAEDAVRRPERRAPWRPFTDPAAQWLNWKCESSGYSEQASEATYFADRAAGFLHENRERPFALVVSFHEPHAPFTFPNEWSGLYRPSEFDVPPVSDRDRKEQPLIFRGMTPDEVRGVRAAYYTSLAFLDHSVGRVLDALEAEGLAENTIVVYLGDNGYMLGRHGRFEKHVLYDPAVRVPLMVRWPGRIPAGRRVPEQVELVDVLPTLLDLVGVPVPSDLHGRSLKALLMGEPGARGRDIVVSEYLENEEAMARSERYKLIVGTGRRARRDGYVSGNPTPGPYSRLFDLRADPEETDDLSAAAELGDVRERLLRAMYERLTTTRPEGEHVPEGLTERVAVEWCLRPRDDDGSGEVFPKALRAKP